MIDWLLASTLLRNNSIYKYCTHYRTHFRSTRGAVQYLYLEEGHESAYVRRSDFNDPRLIAQVKEILKFVRGSGKQWTIPLLNVQRAPVGAGDKARAGACLDALLGAFLDHLKAGAHTHPIRLLPQPSPELVVACVRTARTVHSIYFNTINTRTYTYMPCCALINKLAEMQLRKRAVCKGHFFRGDVL